MDHKQIAIVGGGLVGSLLSLYLVKRGYQITIFERRPDMRKIEMEEGHSINMALSNRGIRSLLDVNVFDKIKGKAIPMHGRMIHDLQGHTNFQPYGKGGEYINSIARNELNKVLIDEADARGVQVCFEHQCIGIDINTNTLHLEHQNKSLKKPFDLIFGADGSSSAVRNAFHKLEKFEFSQQAIEYGYKELTIPATYGQSLKQNALHIWPRKNFMLIALPNTDGSFTCTLFLPLQGAISFATLGETLPVEEFFLNTFADAVALMPFLFSDFQNNPTASLATLQCLPWYWNNTLLVGDAAHAVVPFYGQGMNAGFEDCHILNKLLNDFDDDWEKVFSQFQHVRKHDTDAIAQLSMDNFIEMRNLVTDPDFLLRKKIETKLHALYPEKWIPLYSMVTFHENIGYAAAYAMGQQQKLIMDEIMRTPEIITKWEGLDFKEIVNRLWVTAIQ